MRSVRFIVPWRTDDGERARIWEFCRARWEAAGYHPIESPSPEGPFNRAAAINAGADAPWDMLVIADADVVVSLGQLGHGIELATQTDQVVFPFRRYVGLTPENTETVLAGGGYSDRGGFRSMHHTSSVVIVPRAAWERIGPYDERFTGWGFEDTEWARRARPYGRVRGDVYHLWHPRSEHKRKGPLWEANRKLAATLR